MSIYKPTVPDALIAGQIRENARKAVPVIGPRWLCEGRRLAICGAGPSLVQPEGYNEVWACNRAALEVECSHAVAIEPTRAMCDVWSSPPAAVFFLASVVSPYLVEHLLAHGRRVAFFHSIQTARREAEVELYIRLFSKTALTHTGMNVVSRAVDLALWLGYSVDLYGCDMAFGEGHELYADGTRYDGGWWLTTEIDDRRWRTKGDMLYTAQALVRLQREHPDRVTFIGDTLPRALQGQPDHVLNREWETEERAA